MDQKEYYDNVLSRNYDTIQKMDRIKNSRWRKFFSWCRKKRNSFLNWWRKKKNKV